MKDVDDKLSRRVAESLDQSAEALDSATLTRLAEMRARALDAIPDKKTTRKSPRNVWILTGSLACTLMVAAVLAPNVAKRMTPSPDVTPVEWLASSDDAEMFEEQDVDFYLWLEDEQAI